MPLDPTIPLRVGGRRNSLMDQYGQAMHIKNAQLQQRAIESEMQQAEAARASEERRRNLLRESYNPETGDFDWQGAEARLMSEGDVDTALTLRKQRGSEQSAALTEQAKRLEVASKQIEAASRVMNPQTVRDQASYDAARQQLQAMGVSGLEMLPAEYNPRAIEQVFGMALSAKERIDMELERQRFEETRRSNRASEGFRAREVAAREREATGGPEADAVSRRRAERIREAQRVYGMSEQDAAALVDGDIVVQSDPVTGERYLVNKATGQERRPEGPAAAPADPVQSGRTLWDLAEGSTGAVASVQSAIAGPASQLGMPYAENVVDARRVFAAEKRNLIRALSNNRRFPVAEMQSIEREIDIEPDAWNSTDTLRTKMKAVDEVLARRSADNRRAATDASLPAQTRQDAAAASKAIDDFRRTMGVPDSGAPRSAGRGAATGVQRITSDAEYDALPSGAVFVAPDGKTRRKP